MIKVEIERKEELPYNELVKLYKRVFDTEDGKTVLSDILSKTHFLSSSFMRDDKETFFNEGMRNVSLMILGYINTDPNLIEEGQSKEDTDVF